MISNEKDDLEFNHWLEIESQIVSDYSKSNKHSTSALIAAWARKAWHASIRRESLELLENDCLIGHTLFAKGTPKKDLIKYAENAHKARIVESNSKIKFEGKSPEWCAHNVPFFGRVQLERVDEDEGFSEWVIFLGGHWQGPFSTRADAIEYLEERIKENEK